MSILFEKLVVLKKKVGGNREIMGFEHTFGQPIEEAQNITPTPKHMLRILSEAEFAIRLSEALEGKYDGIVEQAIDLLTAAMAEDGTLTKSVCAAAEQILMPLEADAKAYKLILAGHAHIDMNWMWGWHETVAATVATFTTMLNIMEEYPQFCFSQSQTSVYEIIDKYAPELHDKIKARIDEGRWEVTSSAWVETDKNMPNTESLLRHIQYSKKYLGDKWGIPADKLEVDFSPDTFGHSANLPEIDTYGGVKYYYHCRALKEKHALYRWKSPSGKELMVYCEQQWYNSGITPRIAMHMFDVSARCGGLKTGLVVYGVGDHGGGPTRRDVERALEMQTWPIFPTIKFGTFREFFLEAESVREKLPLVEHELNFIFPGCYTTQSRVKKGNRRCEAALSEAETALAFAHTKVGADPRTDAVREAWQKVLFTHFHDILTGSCVQESREYAMGLFQDALAVANTETGLALNKLAAAIDTSAIPTQKDPDSQAEGAGVGYNVEYFSGRAMDERGGGLTRIWNVFNNTYADKNEPVEITVWDWTGDMRYIRVFDINGDPLQFQLLDMERQKYWDHKYFRILVDVNVPAMSYVTVALSQKTIDDYPVFFQTGGDWNNTDENSNVPPGDCNYVLKNEYIRCEFDYSTGEMVSLQDVATGKEYLACGKRAGVELIDTNANNSSAWHIGTHLDKSMLADVSNIRTTSKGSLRNGFLFDARIRSSKVRVEYTLDKGSKYVKAHIHADWSEVGGEKVPVLAYELPTSVESSRFVYNVPGGCAIRRDAEQDRPGLSYIAAVSDEKEYVGIVSDCKYGFRGITRDGKAVMISTLINTAVNPDPYPERGIQDIVLNIGLYPACPAQREREVQSAVRTLTPISVGSHKGTLPANGTFLKVDAPAAVVSAVFAEDNTLSVRLYSVSGEETQVTLEPGCDVKAAACVDLYGKKLADCAVDANKVTVKIPAYSMTTVRMTL